VGSVNYLVRFRQPVKEVRQVTLCQGMERQAWLIKKKNCVTMGVLAFNEKNQIKAKEPLEPSATTLQFDVFRSKLVGNPNTEMVAISLKAEAVIALLPPLPKPLG